jgi:DMSO/TMAO reductase YedYZ molybdopterin-dependent catalytic subunit
MGGVLSMKTKLFQFFGFMLVFLVGITAFVNSCSAPAPEKAKELASVQVKEYQGEKLSSITDFRENSIKGPQQVEIDKYLLKVTGLVNSPLSYTYNDALSKHQAYTKLITLNCVEGWSVKLLWEGLLIKDFLNESGIKAEAKVVIFHAYDGYTTSLPLSYILEKNLLLAYKMNGVPLPPERGYPFELAAEDKWGYKLSSPITRIIRASGKALATPTTEASTNNSLTDELIAK